MVKVEFTDEYQKILWQISLFKDMDVSLQRRLPLELELSVYEVARKEVVLKQDTYCNHLYVLLKGELEVNIVDVAGNLVKVEDIRAPRALFDDTLSGFSRFSPLFYVYMRSHYWYELTGEEAGRFKRFYESLSERAKDPTHFDTLCLPLE